jgi:hypothetical protein
MKVSTLFIVLFLATQVAGEPLPKIKQLLNNKDFSSLKIYIDNPERSNVNFHWQALRTIVGDYQEGIIRIEENVPSNDGTGGSLYNNYKVYLLADRNKIFYYKLIKTVYKNNGSEQSEKNEQTIDSSNDQKEYVSFENSFRKTYGVSLNHLDLFLTSIVYGSQCGIVGIDPEYMKQLNLLLQNNDIETIRHWLKSANAEKQLYALKGYRILVNQGYNMTEDEKKIISIVKRKKGTVLTCSGCLYMDETFQTVVSEINSIPSEHLKLEKTNSVNETIKRKQSRAAKNSSYIWLSILGILAVLTILYFRRKKGGV